MPTAARAPRRLAAAASAARDAARADGAVPRGGGRQDGHLVRHAAAAADGADLSATGEASAPLLAAAAARALPSADLVVASPLPRALRTAELAFAAQIADGAAFVARDAAREVVDGAADARPAASALAAQFAAADVGDLAEEDALWAAVGPRIEAAAAAAGAAPTPAAARAAMSRR